MKYVYVVVSHSGSVISRLIRAFTKDEYSHVSVALDGDLSRMYSFSRLHTQVPIPGGFVRESRERGILCKFKNAEIVVLRIATDDAKYAALCAHLDEMYAERDKYHYNYRGFFAAGRGKPPAKRKYYYYCSEFVKDILERFRLVDEGELPLAVRPVGFLRLRRGEEIYRGRLSGYTYAGESGALAAAQ